MPQTKEAIVVVLQAGVPIIFAINKIDKESRIFSINDLVVEDWEKINHRYFIINGKC